MSFELINSEAISVSTAELRSYFRTFHSTWIAPFGLALDGSLVGEDRKQWPPDLLRALSTDR